MSDKIKTGKLGEKLAADFLEAKGFEIVAKNYRFRKSEVDLIAKKDDWLLFIEVKTRSSVHYGQPEDFVYEPQANRIFDAADEFIFSTDWRGHVRFDIISVKMNSNPPEILHMEDAIN